MIALGLIALAGLAWGCAIAWRGAGGQLDPQDPIGDWDEVLAEVNTIPDRASLEREIRLWAGRERRYSKAAVAGRESWVRANVANLMVMQLRALRAEVAP